HVPDTTLLIEAAKLPYFPDASNCAAWLLMPKYTIWFELFSLAARALRTCETLRRIGKVTAVHGRFASWCAGGGLDCRPNLLLYERLVRCRTARRAGQGALRPAQVARGT